MFKRNAIGKTITSIIMTLISVVYLSPIFIVLMNSFKLKTSISASPFVFPNAESYVGWDNYTRGMTFGDYPFYQSVFYSVFITVFSTAYGPATALTGKENR